MLENSKLTEALRGINKDEYRKFGEYLCSPFFNKSKRIVKLYNFFKPLYTKNDFKFSKEKIWGHLYPGEKYNDQVFRILVFEFVKLAEDFIAKTSSLNKEIREKIILVEELRRRGANKSFEMKVKSIYKQLKNNKLKDETDYMNFVYLKSYIVAHGIDKLEIIDKVEIDDIISDVDSDYMYTKLHFYNLELIGKTPLNWGYKAEGWLVSDIVNRIENNIAYYKNEHRLIYMEYLIFNSIIKFFNLEYVDDLIQFVKECFKSLDIIKLTHLFYSFNTQYINAFNGSIDLKFHEKMHEVIRLFEEIKFFENHKFLSPVIFFNVIDISIKAKKTGFSEYFYSKYSKKLVTESGADIASFSRALIHIDKQQFKEAIDCLNKVSMINYQVYLNAKTYLARIYFELNENEAVYYIIDSAMHYLKRNRNVIGSRYSRSLNYFKYLKKLNNCKDKYEFTELKKAINADKYVVGKSWLLEKIDENIA